MPPASDPHHAWKSSGSPRAPCERPSVSWLKSPREDLVSIYAARPEPAKAAVLAEAGHSGQLPAAAPVPIK
jgi:hypothetical protein